MMSFSADLQWASPLKTKRRRFQPPMEGLANVVRDRHPCPFAPKNGICILSENKTDTIV